jgi:hypothetical protein
VSDYVVDIKPSARRANAVVGSVVHRRGTIRRFEAREDAEAWAAGLSDRGSRTVWVRTANPNDPADVDAYLVSRRPARGADATPLDGGGKAAPPESTTAGRGPLQVAIEAAEAGAGSDSPDGRTGETEMVNATVTELLDNGDDTAVE